MLNKLSAKYKQEIALSFIFLFFISGLASAKAQVYYNGVDAFTTYSYGSTHKMHNVRNIFAGFESITSIKNIPTNNRFLKLSKRNKKIIKPPLFLKLLKYTSKKVYSDSIRKVIKFPSVKAPDSVNIGGPSQPEMSTFKSVGSDDMVSPFTGDFSYNVPLLDVGGYPVNMFYSSGITMDQDASWVGLGWNINPGTITRNMRGIPDDFNGEDTIIKRQSIRPDKTYGVSIGGGFKFAGFPLGINSSVGISINNKLGLAVQAGLGASITPSIGISSTAGDTKTASLSASISTDVSVSSRNGASITPSINVSTTQKTDEDGNTTSLTGSIGASYSYSSRLGVEGMHLDAGISKSRTADTQTKNDEEKNPSNKNFSSSTSPLNSSISFLYPTIVPSVQDIFTRSSYALSFSLGSEAYAINPHATISGFYTQNIIAKSDQTTSHSAYGMLYYDKANNDNGALLDFNRGNDVVFTPGLPVIDMPIYTYDIFSINGEGVGGSFRATRSDLGFMRDPHVKTRDNSGSVGVDIGLVNIVHGGITFSYTYSPTVVGSWRSNNAAAGVLNFQANKGPYQAVYFRNPGEKTIPNDIYQNNVLGGENLVRLKMGNVGSGDPILLPNLIRYDQNKNNLGEIALTSQSVIDTLRSKRTQVISYLDAEDAARVGFDKSLYSYHTDNLNDTSIILGGCNSAGIQQIQREGGYRKHHHISEINVLGTDGRKYVYGLPVYNTKQVDVSFGINNGSTLNGKSNYQAGIDDTTLNTQGRDWYMKQEETPAYTHAFLLTALVSPNYVDVTGDGITNDDIGDAIKFNYTQFTQGYKWRTPVGTDINTTGGMGVASYNEGLKTDQGDDKAHYVYGEREMWHLYSIESKNMVARFYVKNDRKDCKQVLRQSGGVDNNWGMQRLDRICLYSKSDILKHGNNAKPIKTVQFFQSYKLCPGADNSNKGYGKLTLDSIWIT